jgi:hypothetical protein
MQEFIEQIKHNEDFHISIGTQYPTKFFDWKVTCLFYIAVHCLKALAAKKGVNIGSTHKEVELSVSPLKGATIMPLSQTAWNNYSILYRYSMTARYDGIGDIALFEELKKRDYNHALQCLNRFKGYIKGQGVPLIDI